MKQLKKMLGSNSRLSRAAANIFMECYTKKLCFKGGTLISHSHHRGVKEKDLGKYQSAVAASHTHH